MKKITLISIVSASLTCAGCVAVPAGPSYVASTPAYDYYYPSYSYYYGAPYPAYFDGHGHYYDRGYWHGGAGARNGHWQHYRR